MSVECDLESMDGSVQTRISALTTKKVTGNMKVIDWHKQHHKWKQLKDINFPKLSSHPIVDILIGMDYLELHCSRGDICGNVGDPVARLTPLGWTCVCNVSDLGSKQQVGTFFTRTDRIGDRENTDILMQKFWEVEDISSTKAAMSVKEQKAVEAVEKTLEYHDGRYRVGIPWKENVDTLPDNYDTAFSRLLSIEKKLSKEKSFSDAYSDVISQYVQKDCIHQGPKLQNNLFDT